MTSALFNLRAPSLTRSNLVVLGSLIMALAMSGFPRIHPNFFLIIPALLVLVGTGDTVRCIQRRWCLYHGGVMFCIYMDLLAIALVWFFFLYPYFMPLSSSH